VHRRALHLECKRARARVSVNRRLKERAALLRGTTANRFLSFFFFFFMFALQSNDPPDPLPPHCCHCVSLPLCFFYSLIIGVFSSPIIADPLAEGAEHMRCLQKVQRTLGGDGESHSVTFDPHQCAAAWCIQRFSDGNTTLEIRRCISVASSSVSSFPAIPAVSRSNLGYSYR